jgi:hypothetical protein
MVLMFFGPELKIFQPEGNDGSYVVISVFFACVTAFNGDGMARARYLKSCKET